MEGGGGYTTGGGRERKEVEGSTEGGGRGTTSDGQERKEGEVGVDSLTNARRLSLRISTIPCRHKLRKILIELHGVTLPTHNNCSLTQRRRQSRIDKLGKRVLKVDTSIAPGSTS